MNIYLNLLLSHSVVLDLKRLVCSYQELEVDMMQMCPYLQAAYRCLQQYLCTWVHLVLTGILGP